MQLSQEIFNILKGANIKLKLFDPAGNKTLDPEVSARFYAYDRDFLITIRDEDGQVELVVQAGASFNFDEHKDVLNSIKKAGHNAMAEYNIRKFDKKIEPKDFAHDVVQEENEEILRLKELSGIKEDPEARKMQVTDADRDANTEAWKRFRAGDPRYEYKKLKPKELDLPETEEPINEEPVFPEEVELAGDSRWIEDEMWESDYIEVSDITVETDDDGYTQVHVEHNGPWEIYTDSGFEKEISKLVGRDVHWSEQGMQASGVAHLEAYDMKENVTEGYRPATGSLKTSYIQLPENTKLIINHTKSVNEEIRGSRSRNIRALFIENSAKERFRFPFKYLQGAKAMANHVSHGGTPYDAIGESIIKLCEEVAQCTQFLRHVRTHKLTNESNENIVETIKAELNEMKNTIKSIQTIRGYNSYQNQDRAIVEEKDAEAVDIPSKFMYNTFKNADMNAVLETVARIVKEKDGMTDLTKQNISRLYDMIKNKEDFKLNIDPNDPEHPDNEDPIKYSGGMGEMAKLGAMLSYLAMSSKNDEAFNILSHLGSELYNMPNNHVIMMAKIAKYLDKNNKMSSKEKVEVEEISESILNDLRRKVA